VIFSSIVSSVISSCQCSLEHARIRPAPHHPVHRRAMCATSAEVLRDFAIVVGLIASMTSTAGRHDLAHAEGDAAGVDQQRGGRRQRCEAAAACV